MTSVGKFADIIIIQLTLCFFLSFLHIANAAPCKIREGKALFINENRKETEDIEERREEQKFSAFILEC